MVLAPWRSGIVSRKNFFPSTKMRVVANPRSSAERAPRLHLIPNRQTISAKCPRRRLNPKFYHRPKLQHHRDMPTHPNHHLICRMPIILRLLTTVTTQATAIIIQHRFLWIQGTPKSITQISPVAQIPPVNRHLGVNFRLGGCPATTTAIPNIIPNVALVPFCMVTLG